MAGTHEAGRHLAAKDKAAKGVRPRRRGGSPDFITKVLLEYVSVRGMHCYLRETHSQKK